jgi:hypothetical protein
MKRLFFVLLFALTALFFSACSSSDSGGGNGSNGPAPQNISGKVIIPSAYNTGYIVQVCGDANNSNSCDNAETAVNVNSATGEFSVTTRSDYPLVAEFYDISSTTSGTVVSSRDGHLPVLVYTTPAGESTVSAFTTMVKNKVDTQPGIYNAIAGAEKVKADTGITFDPFNAGGYAANAVLHNTVSAVSAGILEYICEELQLTSDSFSAGVILALYNVVYEIVATIPPNPSPADVQNIVDTNKVSIDGDVIANANASIPGNWNYGEALDLYVFNSDDGTMSVDAARTGSGFVRMFNGFLLPSTALPPHSGTYEDYSLAEMSITKAIVSTPISIDTSDGSKSFTLSGGAKVYTMFYTEDHSKNVDDIYYIRDHFQTLEDSKNWNLTTNIDYLNGVHMGYVGKNMSRFDRNGETFSTYGFEDNITLYPDLDDCDVTDCSSRSGTFYWYMDGYSDPFHSDFPAVMEGNFVRLNDWSFQLTASNGAVGFIVKRIDDPWVQYGQWALAKYPITQGTITFFSAEAAQEILDQW